MSGKGDRGVAKGLSAVQRAIAAAQAANPGAAERNAAAEQKKADYKAAQLADERELGPLLGWYNIGSVQSNGWIWGYHGQPMPGERHACKPLPAWRRDWAGCGPLISYCGITIHNGDNAVSAESHEGGKMVYHTENIHDHPDKDAALRAVIVKVAITVLKTKKGIE